MVLVFLAIVPSFALLVLWGVSTAQLGVDWQKLAAQDLLDDRSGALARDVTAQLQEERRLTGLVIGGGGASRNAMTAQRKRTDDAVTAFRNATAGKPDPLLRGQLRDALTKERTALRQVGEIRRSVDERVITDEVAFRSFTGIIESGLGYFEALGNADNGELVTAFKPLTDLMWADEMLSREDARLSHGWAWKRIRQDDLAGFSEWIGTQNFLLDSEIAPRVTEEERDSLQNLTRSDAWETKSAVETALVGHRPMGIEALPRTSAQWRQAMGTVKPGLDSVITRRATVADGIAGAAVDELKARMRTYGELCLGTVLVVIVLSVLLTGSLRRRILALRDEAARMETELPEVMERLRAGEEVDVDAEVRAIPYRHDELGRLGRALDLARRAAVETAVRETEQHRGFQQMLQRIARRTQLLIGLQLKKLDEMERGQEDPEVLEGLFDLDHLTSRLRRYEENLVVLGGGQPQRHWRSPVRIVDVLRAALGEVQDYRRIRIYVTREPWVSGRAVGALVHILAELLENAAAFSKPPNPVEARAGLVGRGLAVEIEDRGIGMDPEGYEAVNVLMAGPPELDVISRAEDARLGLYVVARLAADLGLQVEFRPSVYGGTRVIVMVPAELVADPPAPGAADIETPVSSRARLRAANTPEGTGRHRATRRGDDPAAGSTEGSTAGSAAGTTAGQAPRPHPASTSARGPGPESPSTPGPDEAFHSAQAPGPDPVPVPDPVRGAPSPSVRHRAREIARPELMPAPAPASGAPPRPPQMPAQGGLRDPGAGRAGGRAAGAGVGRDTTTGRGTPGTEGAAAPPSPDAAPRRSVPSWAHTAPAPLAPLPRRVRQAGIAPETEDSPGRGPRRRSEQGGGEPLVNPHPERSGAAIGAFQRQSRRTRDRPPQEADGPPRDADGLPREVDQPRQQARQRGRPPHETPPAAGAPAPESRPTPTEDAP